MIKDKSEALIEELVADRFSSTSPNAKGFMSLPQDIRNVALFKRHDGSKGYVENDYLICNISENPQSEQNVAFITGKDLDALKDESEKSLGHRSFLNLKIIPEFLKKVFDSLSPVKILEVDASKPINEQLVVIADINNRKLDLNQI